MSEFFEESRKEYYSRLRAITDDNKWNEWINYFLGVIINQTELNTQRAKLITQLYGEMKNIIQEVSKSRNAIQIQDFLFSKIMFETPDFTKSTNLSKPHAARIIRNLLEHKIIEIISHAKGRRPAIYAFSPLMEII